MTLTPLAGFKALTTHHCVTGSMRHIYEFHGYPISEDLLLGLGAGVGFIYWHMKGVPPLMGGRANVGRPGEEGMEKTAGRRTGVLIESFYTGSAKKAEKALLDLLAAGEPVMLQVDMGFLPYFDLPDGFHFGWHVVVAAGLDLEGRQALIADRDGELHPVSLDALAQARGSKFKPFPPANHWYTFDFGGRRAPQPADVQQAIAEACAGMLKPPIANIGVEGIHTAADRIRQWPQIMGEDELRMACFNAFIYIDASGGTGGGLFRYMYRRFLGEAAEIAGERRLAGVGEEMRAIGDRWQEVAFLFKEAQTASDPAARLSEIGQRLLAIADCERVAWERLGAMLG